MNFYIVFANLKIVIKHNRTSNLLICSYSTIWTSRFFSIQFQFHKISKILQHKEQIQSSTYFITTFDIEQEILYNCCLLNHTNSFFKKNGLIHILNQPVCFTKLNYLQEFLMIVCADVLPREDKASALSIFCF